jgi:N-acyl homoserine lactone hydrolase
LRVDRILPGMGIRSNVGTMGAAGVTLVSDDVNVLVDTGHFGGRDWLLSALKGRKIEPREIDVVVLTHLHWDHCLNVDIFKKAKVLLGKKELDLGSLSGAEDAFTGGYKRALKKMDVETVGDGEKISNHTTAVLTPGHSPGHLSVAVREKGRLTLMSGDAVPNYRAYLRGFPDFSFYDKGLAKKSVLKVKRLKPDMVIPGHDSPFNDRGYVARDKFELILRRENEENSVISFENVPADKPVVRR